MDEIINGKLRKIDVGYMVDVDCAKTGHEENKTESGIVLKINFKEDGKTDSYKVYFIKKEIIRDVYSYEILGVFTVVEEEWHNFLQEEMDE